MKKILILISFCFLFFCGICHTSFAEPTKGFSLGIKIGTFPIVSFFNSYRFGGEVGYQFTNSVSIIGEFAYGEATNSWPGAWGYIYNVTYSCIPIRASLLLPLIKAKTFLIYWGLGLGYYLITVKINEIIRNQTKTIKLKGLAPHLNIDMELRILKRVAIFGELKQVFGPEWIREIERYSAPWKKNVHFRRPELIIGIRFYFKD
jgi:hypothetical protein